MHPSAYTCTIICTWLRLRASGKLRAYTVHTYARVHIRKTACSNARTVLRCEDEKACLGEPGLGSKWNMIQAKDLRQYSSLQYLCLNNFSGLKNRYSRHADVCHQWAKCLNETQRLERIKETLEALGASKAQAPQLPSINLLQTGAGTCM